MYSCVGIQAGRFHCLVFTLEDVMSGRFITGCVHALDYE